MSDDDETCDEQDTTKGKDKTEESSNTEKGLDRSPSVRKKLKALAFGSSCKKNAPQKESSKKKKSLWTTKLSCRQKHNVDMSETSVSCTSCICTGYKKKEETPSPENESFMSSKCSLPGNVVTLDNLQTVVSTIPVPSTSSFELNHFSAEDCDEMARKERLKEIEEGIDPPPGFNPQIPVQSDQSIQLSELTMVLKQELNLSVAPYRSLERLTEAVGLSQEFLKFWERHIECLQRYPVAAHSQIDYVHCLVPDLMQISSCSFYWGKMDRYEAEKLLDKRTEGTFLLRDSAQEEFLFSVSFRRYGRTLHARIEQWNHKFSFDSHDPGVFASDTVCRLIEHYKDPSCCMFFEPMLTIPLNRSFVFPLQHLCRSVISNCITYDGINCLSLPRKLKFYLKEYHYKQRIRVRRFDEQ